jgi:hypothetical protein
MAKDIVLDSEFDLKIVNGDFVIDESETQEVALILSMSQGELKSDPLIGANLIEFIRGGKDKVKIEKHIRSQLELDDKDYDDIKENIKI